MWRAARRALVVVCGLLSQTALADVLVTPSESRLILRLEEDRSLHPAAARNAATPAQRLAALLTELRIDGIEIVRELGGDILVARFAPHVSAAQALAIRQRLQAHPALRYAEPDGRVRPVHVPADPLRAGQWFHYEAYGVDAYTAWDRQRGAPGVVMALLDSGIRPHEDLNASRVLPGFDFVSDVNHSNDGDGPDDDPRDPGDSVAAGECGPGEPAQASSWHGLHLAGVMVAEADNNVGIAGLNHRSRLLPVRVLGKCGGSYADIIAGILWAVGLPGSGASVVNPTPARVINLSFAADESCTAGIQDAIDRAVVAGAVVVAAAGNGYGANVAGVLPAGCNNVVTVAASTRGGDIAAFSNVGARVALSAPGGDAVAAANGILSLSNAGPAAPGADDYAYLAGTSVASAQVTAAVSLLLSTRPTLTVSNVRTILRQSAQAFPAGACPAGNCGAGILNLDAAVRMAESFATGTSNAPAAQGGGGGGCALRFGHTGSRNYDIAWLLLTMLGVRAIRGARTGLFGR